MKKLILIYFLFPIAIGTCLAGSTSTAKVADPPLGNSLVDYPQASSEAKAAALPLAAIHPGREESKSPAQMDSSYFFLEIPTPLAPDTLWLRYWTDFLKQKRAFTPGQQVALLPSPGNFFEGNSGYKRYRIHLPEQSSPTYFSLRDHKTYLIQYWTFNPGDQIRIRADLQSGTMLFVGKSADFYNAQYEIHRAGRMHELQAHPLMFTADPDRLLSDSLAFALYEQSLELPDELFLPMKFWLPSSPDSALLDSILTQNPNTNPIIQSLASYNKSFNEAEYEQLKQMAWGEFLSQTVPKLRLGKSLLNQPELFSKFEQWLSEVPISTSPTLIPNYLTAINDLILLRTEVRKQSLMEGIADLSPYLQDRILGLYALSNFKQVAAEDDSMMKLIIDQIKSPWIAALILDMQSKSSKGSPFYSGQLLGVDGKTVSFEQYRGKTLILSFWISGCKFCMKYYQSTLKPVFEYFKSREDIQFIAVNADKNSNTWRENALSGLYSHPQMIQLHEDAGEGILSYYKISSYPQKILVGQDYRINQATQIQYSPEELIQKIEELSTQSFINPNQHD